MKKIILLLTFFFLSFAGTAFADSSVTDNAGILSNLTDLQQQAAQLSNQTKAGVFVITTNDNNQTPQNFAQDYLQEKVGTGNNGIVLLIDMGQRQVFITSSGNMRYYMTASRINSILDVVQPALTSQDYNSAINAFFTKTSSYFQAGIPGNYNYTVNPETGEVTFHRSFQPLNILIAIVVAALVAGGSAFYIISKYQLRIGANWKYPYQENGKIQLADQRDVLINSFVTTRRIPRPSNNGGGGSGGGFSGGGRSF